LNYQYYTIKNGLDYREIYFDFSFEDPTNAAAERRRVNVSGPTLTVVDTSSSGVVARRWPRFRNQLSLARSVNVTYTVDVRPAIYAILAGKKLVATNVSAHVLGNKDSVITWGVWMNGPATGDWSAWGGALRDSLSKKMWDDGTHGM
jgi:hypothetical protein